MAVVLSFFFDIFAPSLSELAQETMVDISSLSEKCSHCSPFQLQYYEKEESVKKMAATIVMNICRTYQETKRFPKEGLHIIVRLLRESIDSTDTIARQVFLVHVTKRYLDVDLMVYLMLKTESMKIKTVVSDDEKNWIEMVKKVIRHKQINEIIDECLTEFGQVADTDEGEQENIIVTLVSDTALFVRGFVGFNQIYINAEHFHNKIEQFKGNIELLQLVSKMDVISVAVHELAHLRIRQRVRDFNMHTPTVAELKGLPFERHEFGIYAERKIFQKQIDWFCSYETFNVEYVEKFTKAIECQSQLPSGFITGALPRAGDPYVDGVSMEFDISLS